MVRLSVQNQRFVVQVSHGVERVPYYIRKTLPQLEVLSPLQSIGFIRLAQSQSALPLNSRAMHTTVQSIVRHCGRLKNVLPQHLTTMTEPSVIESVRAQIDASAGVIFDNDGTLVNTMPSHFRAWRAAAAEHGLELSEEEFYARAGATGVEIVAALNAAQGRNAVASDVQAAKMRYLEREVECVTAVDVVMELAKYAKTRGIPVAVASGGRRTNVVASLRSVGIEANEFFDAVVTAEDVREGKPHPETFLVAARGMGVDAEKCVGFEDGDLGLEALSRAGMRGVDVRELPGYPLPEILRKKK